MNSFNQAMATELASGRAGIQTQAVGPRAGAFSHYSPLVSTKHDDYYWMVG